MDEDHNLGFHIHQGINTGDNFPAKESVCVCVGGGVQSARWRNAPDTNGRLTSFRAGETKWVITWFYSFSSCTYLQWKVGGLPNVLAETRWLETAFSRLKHSCGVEKSCVRFVSLEIRSQ